MLHSTNYRSFRGRVYGSDDPTSSISTEGWHLSDSVLYGIPAKYISRLQRPQNTLARLVAGNCTPGSNLATLSTLHWLPFHDRIKFKIATMTHNTIHTGNPPNLWIWSTGTLRAELYSLLLPTFPLLLVVTSHLVLEVFARQLLLSGIVSHLTSVLAKLSQHSVDI